MTQLNKQSGQKMKGLILILLLLVGCSEKKKRLVDINTFCDVLADDYKKRIDLKFARCVLKRDELEKIEKSAKAKLTEQEKAVVGFQGVYCDGQYSEYEKLAAHSLCVEIYERSFNQ